MNPLENITWKALSTTQQEFAEVCGSARRFVPSIGPLAGYTGDPQAGLAALYQLLKPRQAAALFLREAIDVPADFKTLRSIPLLEMLHSGSAPSNRGRAAYSELSVTDVPEMIALARLTEPGPFEKDTIKLGGYIGVRSAGRLASMAGERLRIPGYAEISAVCTHPDFLGRGYAALLMTAIIRRMLERGDVPFLHSRHDNERAVALYERLGFKRHAMLHLLVLARSTGQD